MRQHKKGNAFIAFGLVLTVSAFLLIGYNLIIQSNAEKTSKNIYEELMPIKKAVYQETPSYIQNPDMQMPVVTVDGYDFIGTLEIPSLDLKLPILSEWNYSKLKISPSRYTGSVYQDNMIICAHNYRKHFARISSLEIGDLILFTDMKGNLFSFKVSDIELLNPNFAQNMTAGNWDLTLFTCNLAGNARVTVRCVREIENSYGV